MRESNESPSFTLSSFFFPGLMRAPNVDFSLFFLGICACAELMRAPNVDLSRRDPNALGDAFSRLLQVCQKKRHKKRQNKNKNKGRRLLLSSAGVVVCVHIYR